MAEEREQEKSAAAEEKTAEAPSLLDDIVTATNLKPKDEGYSLAKKGVEALMSQLVEPGRKVDKVSSGEVHWEFMFINTFIGSSGHIKCNNPLLFQHLRKAVCLLWFESSLYQLICAESVHEWKVPTNFLTCSSDCI